MIEVQRRLASKILKCGRNRVKFDPDRLEDIKEAITKTDIRSLIRNGVIQKKPLIGNSGYWIKKKKHQKSQGKLKGFGSRKGKKTARLDPKRKWINKIRLQRNFIMSLRDKNMITSMAYHELYMKSKGGFFRSLRHLNLYTQERGFLKNEKR